MNWYYGIEGQQHGPVSDEQLDALLNEGKINLDTPVWCDGMPDWQTYRQARNTPPPPPIDPNPPAPAAGANGPEAVCTECGRIFPADETILYGKSRVCAACKPAFLQKLREGAAIQTGGLNYAPNGNRIFAYIIDAVIMFAFNFIMGMAMSMLTMQSVQSGGTPVLSFLMIGIEFAVAICYEALMVGRFGGTLGKLAVKIKVVNADGSRVSYAKAFGRYFAKLLSGLTCLIGFIIAFFDSEKRALHDRICNTRVVVK